MARGPAYARRKDANHSAIRDEYRRLGCYVKDIDFVADLFVISFCVNHFAIAKNPGLECDECRRMWVEVKAGPKDKLTESELEWQLLLGSQYAVVRSIEDVAKSIENARKGINGS